MRPVQKTRVLILGRFSRSVKGGVQHYAYSILDALLKEKNEDLSLDYLVANSRFRTQIDPSPLGQIYALASLGIIKATPLAPTFPFWALFLTLRNRYKIIHFNFPDPLALVTFLFLPKRKGALWIVSWHSDVIRQKSSLKWYLPLLKRFYKRVDMTLFGTEALLNTSTQFPGGPSQVIPFFIPVDHLRPDGSRLPEVQRPFFFALGRFVYYKGYEYLIEAMKTIPAHLYLCGNGPLKGRYEELIATYGLENKITIITDVSDGLAAWMFENCHAFCLPSIERTEAFGIVQVEAMFFGKPIINCDLGNGVNEVAPRGKVALTSPPKNTQQLASNMNMLLTDKSLYNELSKNAKDQSRLYTSKAFIERLSRVYSGG